MIALLVTDASYCQITRTGAWAVWAESNRGRVFGGNALAGSSGGSNSAEMHAAVRGLDAAIKHGVVASGDHVVFQTDSNYVACRLRPDYQSRRSRHRSRRGLPQPSQQAYGLESPRLMFLSLVVKHQLTLEIVCSRQGYILWHVDRFARACMVEERARRQCSFIEEELTIIDF